VKPDPAPPRGERRGPVPARAGTSLLVHDLKNLAARLAVLGQNLDRHYQDPLFKRSALEVLDDTAVHLNRLAGDLRDHADRILVKLKIDLNQVLAAAVDDSRPDLEGRVLLEERYAPLPVIWGDAYLLRRAFACGIENALQAMDGTGTLSLETRRHRREGRNRIRVVIADTGPGMTREQMKYHLFRPLRSSKPHGLGLGMYTMRQVATLHGGKIRIVSEAGRGTRVLFQFPVEEE
jgi:signal transduction histidine kinase